jgi:hypothetical protein
MTLFIRTARREFQISDLYVMALSFCIFFAVGLIVKSVLEKQQRKKSKNIQIPNPRGGSIEVKISDETELALTILSCIADNERYLVKDPEVRKVIFGLVKEKLKNESLVITPNMMRFLALKLLKNDQSLIAKIGSVVVSSTNRARLLARVSGAAMIGFLGALVSTLPYAILLVLIFFESTENCGYKCDHYFDNIPQDQPVRIYDEKPTGHLAIAGNDDARQIEIYTPSKASDEVISSSTGKTKVTKSYNKSTKKAKEVKFSDFKKKDPVLSSFKDLEEPSVPQKLCPIKNPHDIIGIRID